MADEDEGSTKTIHIHITKEDLAPDMVAKREIGILFHMISAGFIEGLRAMIDSFEEIEPGHWAKTVGRFILRTVTIKAIEEAHLPIVQYLCEKRAVPALGDDANDEYGTYCSPS